MEYLCSLYSHFFSFFFFLKKDRMENKLNELLPLCFDFATMNETLNELLPLCFDFATMKESWMNCYYCVLIFATMKKRKS